MSKRMMVWTPAQVAALRLALRLELAGDRPWPTTGLALASLAAIRVEQGEAVCVAVCVAKAARLATILRASGPNGQALWRRASARARRLLATGQAREVAG